MKGNLGRFVVCAMLLLVGGSPFMAAPRTQSEIARSGTTVVSAVSSKGKATVIIHTAIFNRGCGCSCPLVWEREQLNYLKELNLKDMSVVQGLEISTGGRQIEVPPSVYGGLFDPSEASLHFENGSFVLRIDGADAAYSYYVRLYFDESGLKRMLAYSGLAPNQPTMDTRFFHVVVGP